MIDQSTQGLVGHLNFIHPNWVQILSETETDYLDQLDPIALQENINKLDQSSIACIIVTGGASIPTLLRALAESSRIPLLRSPYSGLEVIWLLRTYLERVLAPPSTLHGVLLDVLGVGVMITGESGVGKSELALELVSRGHGLVADDVVELRRIAPETLEGVAHRCYVTFLRCVD